MKAAAVIGLMTVDFCSGKAGVSVEFGLLVRSRRRSDSPAFLHLCLGIPSLVKLNFLNVFFIERFANLKVSELLVELELALLLKLEQKLVLNAVFFGIACNLGVGDLRIS